MKILRRAVVVLGIPVAALALSTGTADADTTFSCSGGQLTVCSTNGSGQTTQTQPKSNTWTSPDGKVTVSCQGDRVLISGSGSSQSPGR